MKCISVFLLSAAVMFAQSSTVAPHPFRDRRGLRKASVKTDQPAAEGHTFNDRRGASTAAVAAPPASGSSGSGSGGSGSTGSGSSGSGSSGAGPTVGFTDGQAARLVIGQTTFTSQDSNSSDLIVGAVSGLAYAADTLFVADANRVGATPSNHRVLLYQNLSGMLPGPTTPLTYNRKCPVCLGQATTVLGVRWRARGGGRYQSQSCADLESHSGH
jgi:hypothetical protein